MRWTRGLQTEVLEHMPPCSAPRWLLIACMCAAHENLAGIAKWCSTVARRLQRKSRNRKRRRCFRNINDWLLSSMADNDNFECVDVLTGGALAGNDPVASAPATQAQRFARSTASWRVPAV